MRQRVKACHLIIYFLLCITLSHCSSFPTKQDGAPDLSVNVANIKNPVPRPLTKSRYGNPPSYVVNGKRYFVLQSASHYNQTGIASWYGTKFHGRLTSTREPYNMYAMTAASPVLPIPCYVRVTNLENGKQVIVKVNDRGPFAPNRIIDLSYVAALKLGYEKKGTTLVRVSSFNLKNNTLPHKPAKLYLQIGAFSQYPNASHAKLKAAQLTNEPVHILSSSDFGVQLFKVQVGPLYNIAESDQLLQQLSRQGYQHAFSIVK